jgi:hypothetical protein
MLSFVLNTYMYVMLIFFIICFFTLLTCRKDWLLVYMLCIFLYHFYFFSLLIYLSWVNAGMFVVCFFLLPFFHFIALMLSCICYYVNRICLIKFCLYSTVLLIFCLLLTINESMLTCVLYYFFYCFYVYIIHIHHESIIAIFICFFYFF